MQLTQFFLRRLPRWGEVVGEARLSGLLQVTQTLFFFELLFAMRVDHDRKRRSIKTTTPESGVEGFLRCS